MSDPTPEDIRDALVRAKELMHNNGFDLLRALAEATTTAQCRGIQGFKVFRDVRAAIPNVHLITDKRKALAALDAAIKEVAA